MHSVISQSATACVVVSLRIMSVGSFCSEWISPPLDKKVCTCVILSHQHQTNSLDDLTFSLLTSSSLAKDKEKENKCNSLSFLSEASPDAVSTTLGGAVNSDPGSPSDDEDLPHPASSMRVTCEASPTGSDEGSLIVNGACYYEEDSVWGEPTQMAVENLLPVVLSSHTHRQVSLNDYLDALEVARNSGDRPMTGPLPKLRSSFPTDTRLNAMLHIDSDEDEETAGQHREQSQEARNQRGADASSQSATTETQLVGQSLNLEPQGQVDTLSTTDTCSFAGACAPQPGNDLGPRPAKAVAGLKTGGSTTQTSEAFEVTTEDSAFPSPSKITVVDPEVRSSLEENSSQEQSSRAGTSQEAFGSSSFALLSPIQVSFIKF